MSNATSLLGESFRNALQEAAELDQKGIIPEDPDNLFADGTLTHVQIVQGCLDFYNEHQGVMDTAIQNFNDYLGTAEGAAYVKALHGALESPESELSARLASEIAVATELGSKPQSLVAFGIGGSAGASLFAGVTVGGDIVFDFQNKEEVIPRKWMAGTIKTGLSANAGIELSFWVDTPVSGVIAGWLLDVYTPFPTPIFYRFLYIKQRQEGETNYTFSGVSLQYPFGLGLPLRRKKEKHPGLLGGFLGKQTAKARSRRATLGVVNANTGLPTISVDENTSLTVTVKNTSDYTIILEAGSTISLAMPTYFTAENVADMSIDYSGWAFSNDGSTLTLTLNSSTSWSSGSTMTFTITNVASSGAPPLNQQSQTGFVTLTMNATSFSEPLVLTSEFDLVWSNSSALLTWSVNVTDDFTLNGPSQGSLLAWAMPGTNIEQLVTVTDSSGTEWILGYVYNYNTHNNASPQVFAAWWKSGSVKVSGTTVFYGPYVTTSGDQSVAHYAGITSNPNYIEVTPVFNP